MMSGNIDTGQIPLGIIECCFFSPKNIIPPWTLCQESLLFKFGLKNMKYLVGEREHMETVLVLQFSRTQHIKCCEFLCTTACGFPAVGMLLCLLYFRVSLKPPLWPNTTTVHCWCKICPTDHSTTEACLLSSTAISNPRSLLWIFVTVFAPFPSLASFLFPPVSQILRGTRD